MGEHDQRLKQLLQTFFKEFFELFFPDFAKSLNFTRIEWLDKEVFPDPPEGKRRELDLVAKLPVTEPVAFFDDRASDELLALVHVEIESGESSAPIRTRMPRYFFNLTERYELPILPVVLFLRVGLEGVGSLAHTIRFGMLQTLQFRFLYVGLPALDAVEYLEGENVLGVALSVLMRLPAEERARLKAEGLQRIAVSERSERERYLLAECVEAYLTLESNEQQEFEQFMALQEYEEARMLATTSFERGVEKGIEKGIEKGERTIVKVVLEERFGPMSEVAQSRLDAATPERLLWLARNMIDAKTLADLGLED